MADQIDQASDISEIQTQSVLELRKKEAEADLAARRVIDALGKDATRECEECGDDIPLKRLQAAPRTKRCAFCQEAFEKKSGGRR